MMFLRWREIVGAAGAPAGKRGAEDTACACQAGGFLEVAPHLPCIGKKLNDVTGVPQLSSRTRPPQPMPRTWDKGREFSEDVLCTAPPPLKTSRDSGRDKEVLLAVSQTRAASGGGLQKTLQERERREIFSGDVLALRASASRASSTVRLASSSTVESKTRPSIISAATFKRLDMAAASSSPSCGFVLPLLWAGLEVLPSSVRPAPGRMPPPESAALLFLSSCPLLH